MFKTGYYSGQYTRNFNKYLKDITSLTVSNLGVSNLMMTIQGVTRTVKPSEMFVIDGDGSYSDMDITFIFENGSGLAIIDYRQVITPPIC